MSCFLLTVTVFLVLVVVPASALKCYVCAGYGDTCSMSNLVGNKDRYLKTCPSAEDRCIRQWVKRDGNTTVASTCINQDICDTAKAQCDSLAGNDSVDCTVDCCSSDACNAVSTEKASALKCYVCAGTGDTCSKSNLEGNKDRYLKTCPSAKDRCIRVWVKKDGHTAVANICVNQDTCDSEKALCDTLAGNDSVDCTVDCCSSDACNAVSTEKASGLKCYKCKGTEEDCKKSTLEGDKDKYLKTCNSGEDKCMRTWQLKDGVIFVANSCATQLECNSMKASCDELEDSDNVDCAVGCCDTDACNAGSPISLSVFLLSVSSVLDLALLA